jgi:hypothetical protein
MNALERLARMHTPQSDGLVLRLKTQTPLYTGGIGQLGDQVHPSNLLGGIRYMSSLVARALGDDEFEKSVWGETGNAKQVALHWDTSGLSLIKTLCDKDQIKIPKAGGGESKWYFNSAFEGTLGLQLTRRGISDAHWQMLTLALAIQLRHGSFGAKDQFGLGVLSSTGNSACYTPLDATREWPKAIAVETGKPNLLRYAFGRMRFRAASGSRPTLNRTTALTLALAARASLRNTLRAKPDAPDAEKTRLTRLRHLMLGKLNESGSAVNVSAAYAINDCVELRLSVALKPADSTERTEVMKSFSAATGSVDTMIERTGYRVDDRIIWEFGGKHANDRANWINKLAGV